MKIASIQLKNIACFADLFLDFTQDETDEPAPWIVLLGENGTGKSTLLQMIGATLLDLPQLGVVAGNIDLRSYIRISTLDDFKAECSVNIQVEPSDIAYDADTPIGTAHRTLPWTSTHDAVIHPLFVDYITSGWLMCGYGTSRRITGQALGRRGEIPTLDDSAKPYRLVSLFGDASGMTNVPDWLAGLYFRSIYPNHTDGDVRLFESAKVGVLRALPRITDLEVTKERQVFVTEGLARVPLERLSDGYRGTLAWVGDLIRRLFDAYPNSSDPLNERGVVLVDEIDLHLHPRWQRSVVEDIRTLFPNLQFIVTTHSPFVVQDMRPQDRIVVLERTGRDGRGPVIAREETGAVQDWSADQILAAYFGLSRGTRGERALQIEARYERLLDADAAGILTDAQRDDLERLRTRIDRIPIGATPDEQAFDRTADNVITSLRRRRQELEAQSTNRGSVPEALGNSENSE